MDWTDYSDVTEKMEPAKEQLSVLDDLLSYIDSTDKDALFILSPYGMEKEARMKFNDLTERIEAAAIRYWISISILTRLGWIFRRIFMITADM